VEEMRQIKNMLDSFGHSGRVELLPYHGMGEQKCLALGKNAQGFSSPDPEAMDRLNRIFS
jgi:pyruvate-formate lyase-activating enzyme